MDSYREDMVIHVNEGAHPYGVGNVHGTAVASEITGSLTYLRTEYFAMTSPELNLKVSFLCLRLLFFMLGHISRLTDE